VVGGGGESLAQVGGKGQHWKFLHLKSEHIRENYGLTLMGVGATIAALILWWVLVVDYILRSLSTRALMRHARKDKGSGQGYVAPGTPSQETYQVGEPIHACRSGRADHSRGMRW